MGSDSCRLKALANQPGTEKTGTVPILFPFFSEKTGTVPVFHFVRAVGLTLTRGISAARPGFLQTFAN
jgi:hypothetical protein